MISAPVEIPKKFVVNGATGCRRAAAAGTVGATIADPATSDAVAQSVATTIAPLRTTVGCIIPPPLPRFGAAVPRTVNAYSQKKR
jgi:hypothetical protein